MDKQQELREFEDRLAYKIADEQDRRTRQRISELFTATDAQKKMCDKIIAGSVVAFVLIILVAFSFAR